MTPTITLPRATVEQALEALEAMQSYAAAERKGLRICDEAIPALRAALAQQAEPVEPVAYRHLHEDGWEYHDAPTGEDCAECQALYTAPPQRKPLTIERLRDALVASRIIPPAAVEDPDEYDDGVTLHRIEALHRRLT